MTDAWFNTDYGCPLCNRLHAIRQCSKFLTMRVEVKRRTVMSYELCKSCLAQSHQLSECNSLDRCKRCHRHHNTLLHPVDPGNVWFPMTVEVKLYPHQGSSRYVEVRARVNPNAARTSIHRPFAISAGCSILQDRAWITVAHRLYNHRKIVVQCAVENYTFLTTPSVDLDQEWVNRRKRAAVLADPDWFRSLPAYIILGADVSSKLLEGPAEGRPGKIYCQKTLFGEALFGEGIRGDM